MTLETEALGTQGVGKAVAGAQERGLGSHRGLLGLIPGPKGLGGGGWRERPGEVDARC